MHVVVLAGGDPVEPWVADWLPTGAYVVAADSGLAQADALGLRVDLVVGDLDSVDPDALEAAVAAGSSVERHPAAKDHTDLELAVLVAKRLGARRLTLVGGHGGRLDHALANVLALAQLGFAGITIDAVIGRARVAVVHDEVVLDGDRGDLVSLLPAGGAVSGVRTTGLAFALDGEDLEPGTTRGVSNEMVATRATVSVEAGVLLVVRPGGAGRLLEGGEVVPPGA